MAPRDVTRYTVQKDVRPGKDDWMVIKYDTKTVIRRKDTKKEAEQVARRIARNNKPSELLIRTLGPGRGETVTYGY